MTVDRDRRPDADAFARHLAAHPEVLEALDTVYDHAVAAVDPRLLELCRLRAATLLGAVATPDLAVVDAATAGALPRWPDAPDFSAGERVCLAFTEQFVIDVAGTTDEQVAPVVAHLGPDATMDFVHALLVVEQRCRLATMWGTLFDGDAVPPPEEVDS